VFDVNETLFAVDRLRPAFAEIGLDPRLMPV
jgi:2-haloacid dehalogenase